MTSISFKRHRFPPVIIQHAVWRNCHGKLRMGALCLRLARLATRRLHPPIARQPRPEIREECVAI